jgi:hypothetical protein
MALAAPVLAQATPSDAAAAARDRGYYVESGVPVSESRIDAAVSRANQEGLRFYAVILNEDPAGGAANFASAVLDRIGAGTVLVLSSSQEGIESTEFTQTQLGRALDAAFEASDDEGYVSSVADSLLAETADSGSETTAAQSASSDGGGSNAGLFIMLAIIGGLVGLVWFAIRRQKKAAEESREESVDEARAELKSQLDSMANTILEITDHVSASESREDNQYLEAAGATYSAVVEEFESAQDLRALAALADRVDEARWQLDAATALAEGRPVPPKPEKKQRYQCFFDPTHKDATEVAEIKTSAGAKRVRVCKEDAEKLRRGQRPEPRMIEVGGRRIPAPQAPRSYGGGGFGGLDILSVLVGGMGSGRSYDWGRTSGRRRGVFGTSRGGSSASRRSSASRSSGSRRSASRQSSSRSRAGRSRRRRR